MCQLIVFWTVLVYFLFLFHNRQCFFYVLQFRYFLFSLLHVFCLSGNLHKYIIWTSSKSGIKYRYRAYSSTLWNEFIAKRCHTPTYSGRFVQFDNYNYDYSLSFLFSDVISCKDTDRVHYFRYQIYDAYNNNSWGRMCKRISTFANITHQLFSSVRYSRDIAHKTR